MAIGFNSTVRAARLDAITTLLDADASPAELIIYNGVRPATGGGVTTALATFIMGDPSFAPAAGGSMSANAISPVTISNTGTSTWFRFTDGAGGFIADGNVGLTGSGADLEFDSVDFVATRSAAINSFVFNEGNL